MRGKTKRRSEKTPEDKTLGRMLTRLRIRLGIRYEDISEWTAKNGKYIAVSCLHDMAVGRGQSYVSRIPLVARYFQEVHRLAHVTADYLLNGDDIEKQKIEREYEVLKTIKETNKAEQLPLEEFAEKETA